MDRTPAAEASGRGRTASTATGGGGGGVTGTGSRREKERTSSSSTVRSKVSAYQGTNPNEVCYSVCGTVFKVDRIYKDLKPVGKGSYGIVCSAVNSVTGESVAIKKVAPMSTHVMDAKHVLREIRMMRYLGQHENIITLKDLFLREVDDELYIVMELLDSDLHRIIQSKQALSEAHHRFFMHQLLKGLKFLHDHRIIHRDLKPGNLLVTRSCELRITDFGLARARPDEPMTEHVVTRWYRPPELMLCPDGLYTYAVDMWSVGCIFAELLGRKPLFPGKNFVHQLTLIFDVIGPPKPSEVAHVRSSQARRFIESISAKTAVPFASLYPSASPEAIGLLERLLVYDPHCRLTVDEALAHPYFDPLRGVEMQRAVPPPLAVAERLDFSFEKGHIGKGQLKALIVKEVESFRHERRALMRPLAPCPDDDDGLFVMPGSSGHSTAAAEAAPSDNGAADPQAGRRAGGSAMGPQANTRSHAAAARQSTGAGNAPALGNNGRGYGDRGGKRNSLSSKPGPSEQLSGRYGSRGNSNASTPASASPTMDTHMTADISGSCDSSSLPPTKRAGHCCPPSSSSLPGRDGLQRSWGASSLHSSNGGLSASTASRSHYASSSASMGPSVGAHSASGHFSGHSSGATLHPRPSSSATTALPSASSMRYGQCASQATVATCYDSVTSMAEQGTGHMDTSPPNTASTITTVTGGSNTRRRGSVGTHSGGKKMMVVKNGSAAAVMMDMGQEGDGMDMQEEERENMIPDEGEGMEVDGDEVRGAEGVGWSAHMTCPVIARGGGLAGEGYVARGSAPEGRPFMSSQGGVGKGFVAAVRPGVVGGPSAFSAPQRSSLSGRGSSGGSGRGQAPSGARSYRYPSSSSQPPSQAPAPQASSDNVLAVSSRFPSQTLNRAPLLPASSDASCSSSSSSDPFSGGGGGKGGLLSTRKTPLPAPSAPLAAPLGSSKYDDNPSGTHHVHHVHHYHHHPLPPPTSASLMPTMPAFASLGAHSSGTLTGEPSTGTGTGGSMSSRSRRLTVPKSPHFSLMSWQRKPAPGQGGTGGRTGRSGQGGRMTWK